MADPYWDDNSDADETAITKEEYDALDEETHAIRLHWVKPGNRHGDDEWNDYKPRIVNGRRILPNQHIEDTV